jgi:5-hydroxyisourate hydrolase-like protein (transthyretin family)
MKYYNIELLRTQAEHLQELLYNLLVKFEISAAGIYYHFEILLTPGSYEYNEIEKFLFNDAIVEV